MCADAPTPFVIRKAKTADLPAVKKLASDNSKALGFVLRSALSKAIEENRLFVAQNDHGIVGFEEYYHRKRDKQTTLYHKCVASAFRRKGIGTALVDAVVSESRKMNRKFLLLRCPEGLPSNRFHEAFGFRLIGVEKGRRRKLNVWRFDLL